VLPKRANLSIFPGLAASAAVALIGAK